MSIRIHKDKKAANPLYLREWRKHRNLTLQGLADLLDTTPATISRIENCKRDFTGAFLNAVADALSCEPADLLIGPPEISSLWRKLRDANADQRKVIESVAETIIKTGTDN